MCEQCAHPGPKRAPLTRAQFLRLVGTGLAVAAAPGVLGACSSADPADPPPGTGGRTLLDNVRGYTFAGGKLREFGSVLVDGDGRVEALDPGNTGAHDEWTVAAGSAYRACMTHTVTSGDSAPTSLSWICRARDHWTRPCRRSTTMPGSIRT
jgi:hypothetical protein